MFVDERRRQATCDEVGLVEQGLQEWDVGGDATNPELGEHSTGASDRSGEVSAATGHLDEHRVKMGAGVRLDGGTVFVGAEIGAHFDSMLVKVTCRGTDFATAIRRSRRVLAEFRIRGVATNIPFLQSLLDEPDFVTG